MWYLSFLTESTNYFDWQTDSGNGNSITTTEAASGIQKLAAFVYNSLGPSVLHLLEVVCICGFLLLGGIILFKGVIGAGEPQSVREFKANILRWVIALLLFGGLGGILLMLERVAGVL